MALPATGSISFNQVNVEIQRSGTATLSLNDSTVRTVAGVGGSGTQISMSNLRGKSYFLVNNPISGVHNTTFTDYQVVPDAAVASISINSDGTTSAGYNWGSPTTNGIGSNYWVRFTRTSITSSGSGGAAATTGWLQLSNNRSVSANTSGTAGTCTAVYTIEISTNSSGTNIVSTSTGVTLTVQTSN